MSRLKVSQEADLQNELLRNSKCVSNPDKCSARLRQRHGPFLRNVLQANQANLNREELEEFDYQAIFIQDQRNAISLAKKQGIEQGIERGIEEGSLTARVEIAKKLLDSMDNVAISQVTGLTIAEVEALRST